MEFNFPDFKLGRPLIRFDDLIPAVLLYILTFCFVLSVLCRITEICFTQFDEFA